LYALAAETLARAFGLPVPAGAAIAFAVFLALRIFLFRGAREAGAQLALFTWGQPLQRWLAPPQPARVEPGVLPVLFVHGIYCNAGIWHRQLAFLRRRGVPNLFTLNLEPPFAGIDRFAQRLSARAEEVCRIAATRQLIVVAHSMGGLVARAWIARLGGAQRVARLVTIGSPHHGSERVRHAPGRCAADMLPGGEWLAGLQADEKRAPRVPTVSIFSLADELVVPAQSGYLEAARNIPIEHVGHIEMLMSPQIHRIVEAEIAASRSERP
jgi:pimeloyl-ACP methyl ester carboxylesterase